MQHTIHLGAQGGLRRVTETAARSTVITLITSTVHQLVRPQKRVPHVQPLESSLHDPIAPQYQVVLQPVVVGYPVAMCPTACDPVSTVAVWSLCLTSFLSSLNTRRSL